MPSGVYPRKSLKERFWEKVDKRGPDECWEWTGAKSKAGYGSIGKGNGSRATARAHRVSWELQNGPIPEGMCVLHRYDNPGCMNPRHLWLGTHTDNMRDMTMKGRHPYDNCARGESVGMAKLTEQDVREILCFLAAGYLQKEIADAYGACRSTITDIATGRTWFWVHL